MTHSKHHLILCTLAIILSLLCEMTFAAGKGKDPKTKYLPGYYFDNQGHKFTGLIAKDEFNFQFFYFKTELGSPEQKIDATQCDSLTVDHHCYYSIKNIDIKAKVWGTHLDHAFAELMQDGPVQLYCIVFEPGKVGYMKYVAVASNFTGGVAGQVVNYMAGKKNLNYFVKRQENGATYLRLEKSTFKTEMSDYLKDDQAVAQKIATNADYTLNNVELIIREYDDHKKELALNIPHNN